MSCYPPASPRQGLKCIFIALALGVLGLFAQMAAARGDYPSAEPDYLKGETLKAAHQGFALGPTGATANIWATRGREPTEKTRMIEIRQVTKGSPADGALEVGDVILGVISPVADGQPRPDAHFETDARKALSAGITDAEQKKNGGKLVLNVWRRGKARPVTIELPVMGSFSDTSPWECDKTQALIDAACQSIIDHRFSPKEGQRKNWGGIDAMIDVLGLLATGEQKYQPMIRDFARKLGDPNVKLDIEDRGMTSWHWGYTNLFLTEYYLATKDAYVLPAIREYATKTAMGQSGVGTWGHGMAHPSESGGRLHGHATGYGAMNACSLTCAISLVLAQKCGIHNEEIDQAVERSKTFYLWYINKGSIPYGDHPAALLYGANGKNAQAAIFFNLLGNEAGTRFFTKMVLASYHDREVGHTGHFFSWLWGAPGAALGGEKAAQAFIHKTRWFTELERRPGGGAIYQPQLANMDHGKYANWSTTGSQLLRFCLPRKKLYITGKGGSCIAPLGETELASVDEAANYEPGKLKTSDLLTALGDWSPVVREQAAEELGNRDDDVVAQLIAMLDSPNLDARYGACIGLRYAGRDSKQAVDKLLALLQNSDDLTLRMNICTAFRKFPPRSAPQHGLGDATVKAIPALLKQAATYEPVKDPMSKLQAALAETLFYGGNVSPFRGYFPDGKGTEKLDRNLLIPAVRSLVTNPNGRARSIASSVYDHLSDDELNQLWGDIYRAAKYQAPSGTMFAGAVRANGIKLMAQHHVKEGIEVGVDFAFRQTGWGDFFRKEAGIPALKPYGMAMKEYFPLLEAVIEKYSKENKDRQATHWQQQLEQMKKMGVPNLMSIEEYIKSDK